MTEERVLQIIKEFIARMQSLSRTGVTINEFRTKLDQYEARIQFAGHATPSDEIRIVDGSIEERRFVALFEREGRLVAAFGLNRARKVMGYRRQIGAEAARD